MTIKDKFKQDSGSTSVLIVIMMIVLMAFGMAALTTSYAGFKLAENNVAFNQEFYVIEGEATQVKFDVVSILGEVQQVLISEGITELTDYNQMFTDLSTSKISQYIESRGETLLDSAFEIDGYDMFNENQDNVRIGTLYYTVSSKDENPKHISVKFDVYIPMFDKDIELDQVIHTFSWYEWQDGIGEVSNDIFFEDPFENPDAEGSEEGNPFVLPDENGEDGNPFIVPEEDKDN